MQSAKKKKKKDCWSWSREQCLACERTRVAVRDVDALLEPQIKNGHWNYNQSSLMKRKKLHPRTSKSEISMFCMLFFI